MAPRIERKRLRSAPSERKVGTAESSRRSPPPSQFQTAVDEPHALRRDEADERPHQGQERDLHGVVLDVVGPPRVQRTTDRETQDQEEDDRRRAEPLTAVLVAVLAPQTAHDRQQPRQRERPERRLGAHQPDPQVERATLPGEVAVALVPGRVVAIEDDEAERRTRQHEHEEPPRGELASAEVDGAPNRRSAAPWGRAGPVRAGRHAAMLVAPRRVRWRRNVGADVTR